MKKTKVTAFVIAVLTLLTSYMPAAYTITSSPFSVAAIGPPPLSIAASKPSHLSLAVGEASRLQADRFKTTAYTYTDLKKLPSEPVFNYNILSPASAKWLEYVGSEKPATFSEDKITCILADNVLQINNISRNLADMGQIMSGSTIQKLEPGRIVEKGGYISKAVLDTAAGQEVKNGSIIVDKTTGTAFKISSPNVYSGVFDADEELNKLVKPLEGTYSVAKPELHEIVKEFELKEDTVKLNKANITKFAPNVESRIKPLSVSPMSVGDEDKKFKYLTGDNLIELDFKDSTILQGNVGNSTIYVELSGGFAIGGIDLTGRYSCAGGYEISMKLQQECYLVAMLDAEVHEEIRVPILGLDIPFGVGSVYGGIFAIIGMDGTIRLDIEARETSACRMGIEGGTFLYVPTSFNPIFEPEPPKITGDCGMNGQINGYVKFGPMLGLELFGFDVVGAGVLLGAGVNVKSDSVMMDVELYASIDIYIKLLDEHFNLVRARPTIYKKQQPDMHGYRVSFLETYISPGRVGGLIEDEPQKSGAAFLPSAGLDYKIWSVPKNAIGSFDAAKRNAILSADAASSQKPLKEKVRTYPEGAFAKTNAEGEFFEEDQDICYDGDQVWLEFIGKIKDKNGNVVSQTFFVGPATPVLPFTDITITYTDFFNDYITGKVEPKRLINWHANRLKPDEIQTELTYYKGPIFISPFNDYGMEPGKPDKHLPYTISGTAHTDTNDKGEFDTRIPYKDENGKQCPSGTIDILEQSSTQNIYYENGEKKYSPIYPPGYIGVFASLQINGAIKNSTFYGIKPSMPDFQLTRTLDFVEGSYKELNEGEKLVNQMQYDEYIWIANPTGTRAITADMLQYYVSGFSTQDYKGYGENPVKAMQSDELILTPVQDANGKPTGAALFAQRVTLQWVWQAHPNPIKITSADNTQTVAGVESTFQVKAKGFLPRYSIEGAPQRVWIDEETGLLHIAQTVSPGKYAFTIHAKEGIAFALTTGYDPKKGNDASPLDKQTFTLIVAEKIASTSSPGPSNSPSSATPKPSQSAYTGTPNFTQPPSGATPRPTLPPSYNTPEPEKQIPPVIYRDEYNTYFNMDDSQDLTVSYRASGSTPITWSLISATGGPVPAGISINAATGYLTASRTLSDGIYSFAVKASNTAGSDMLQCTIVMAARKAPVLENRRDGYYFTMSKATTDFSVQIKANGSAPIVYSLEAVNSRLPVPAEISIDKSTGLLAVKGGLLDGIQSGVYEFIVRASNAVGSDTRTCKLDVAAVSLPPIRRNLSVSGNTNPIITLLATSANSGKTGNSQPQIATPNLFADGIPPNKLLLRCDDPRDVYTHDRDVYNGAAFIHWDTRIVLTVMKVRDTAYSTGSSLDGQSLAYLGDTIEIQDNTPSCDRYHYYDPTAPTLPISVEELAKIKNAVKKAVDAEMAAYKNGYNNVQKINTKDMTGRYLDFRVNPQEKTSSGLEYGSLVNEIGSKKSGLYTVDLNMDTGTVISGAHFTSLKNSPNASVTFRQDGANITFSGKDIKTADDLDLLNIGFTHAPNEKAMLSSIDSASKSFTYGFQHHGALPGTATFAITTSLAEGTSVNVYRFEASTGGFTLIAKGLTVANGGVVTYKNNTMSEYLITTGTIAAAKMSDMVKQQGSGRINYWWIICITTAVLAFCIAGWVIFRKKKHTEANTKIRAEQ